jgi:uncharacterized protein (DUF1919 family)
MQFLSKAYVQKKQEAADHLFGWYRKRKLSTNDFSVICNDCLAGTGIYKKFSLRLTSPTVGTRIYAEDYVKLLEKFDFYIKKPIEFKKQTKIEAAKRQYNTYHYPLGVINDDIEIHFLHYKNEIEASEKWTRRVGRINYEKLFFIFCDSMSVTEKLLKRYVNLPFEHKIFISVYNRGKSYAKILNDHEDIVIPVDNPDVFYLIFGRSYEKHLDIISWLNGKKDFKK